MTQRCNSVPAVSQIPAGSWGKLCYCIKNLVKKKKKLSVSWAHCDSTHFQAYFAGSLLMFGTGPIHRGSSRYASTCPTSWDFTTGTTSLGLSVHLTSNWNLVSQDVWMKNTFALVSRSFTLASFIQPDTSLFCPFWQLSPFPWLAPFIGLIIVIYFFFSQQPTFFASSRNRCLTSPGWQLTRCFSTHTSFCVWAYQLLTLPSHTHIVPCPQDAVRHELEPIYLKSLGSSGGSSTSIPHISLPKPCRIPESVASCIVGAHLFISQWPRLPK